MDVIFFIILFFIILMIGLENILSIVFCFLIILFCVFFYKYSVATIGLPSLLLGIAILVLSIKIYYMLKAEKISFLTAMSPFLTVFALIYYGVNNGVAETNKTTTFETISNHPTHLEIMIDSTYVDKDKKPIYLVSKLIKSDFSEASVVYSDVEKSSVTILGNFNVLNKIIDPENTKIEFIIPITEKDKVDVFMKEFLKDVNDKKFITK